VSLVTSRTRAAREVIAELEWLLGQARKGEIIQIASAVVKADRTVMTTWTAGEHCGEQMAGIADLFHRFGRMRDQMAERD